MTAAEPSHTDTVTWLRLARTKGLGPVGLARLMAQYDCADAALDALPSRLRKAGRPQSGIPARDRIEAELDAIERAGARLLIPADPDYPSMLAAIPAPPPALTCFGDVSLAAAPCCAMVGARNASAAGLRFAGEIARELGENGVSIVSGLARGIDGAAHRGALETGTIAVLAGGIDHIYPPEHDELHRAIARGGLVLSERPLGCVPTARDFPRRNRLISGLSLGTLVIEAALRSGSLISARFAAEQGREVMAVPGSPMDPRARGSNQLLRDGAHLVETADDVLRILADAARTISHRPAPRGLADGAQPDTVGDLFDDGPDREACCPGQDICDPENGVGDASAPGTGVCEDDPVERVATLLSPTPVSADTLARHAGLPAGLLNAVLMELEMCGRLARLPDGQVQLSQPAS